jgi:uncharacterized protein involved in response to NO
MSTMSQQRAWQGMALFSYGFRPFLLFGALHAGLMVALWVPWHLGVISLPSAFEPVVWHAHELLFGYVPAIVAGFLLTAVPNWTGRLPVVGKPLIALFALWLAARVLIASSAGLPPLVVAMGALAFPVSLLIVMGREIVAAGNKRNYVVLAGVGLLALAQALFHVEVATTGDALYADHMALAVTLALIMLIGGRIVPSFTTNWLRPRGPGRLPVPFNTFDKAAMGLGIVALAGWVLAPLAPASITRVLALLLMAAGIAHLARLIRWVPWRTFAEPLVTVLHLAYLFVPLGFALAALGLWQGDHGAATGATHAWTIGAVGLMTLAVMTRATRGHTGRPLTAPASTVAIYVLILIAASARLLAALHPEVSVTALSVAGTAWVAGFGVFAALYGPMLAGRKPGGAAG